MYLDYFHFNQAPFSITPDPEFVFLSEKHQESLAHLIYGVTRGGGAGFVQLTGEVGTGKTTISRLFLQKLPEDTQAALILNPNITPLELLQNIFKEFKLKTDGIKDQLGALVDRLNEHLLSWYEAGKNTVVIIDEAQNLPRDTLEQLRLLTNLETSQQKLLQIILIGQPELKATMQRRDLRQLAQRITSRFHLQPLSVRETASYIQHRLSVAGVQTPLFNRSVIALVQKLTDGTPRLINTLCDRALLAAFVDESAVVKKQHIHIAAQEVLGIEPRNHWLHSLWLLPLALLLLWWFWFESQEAEPSIPDQPVVTSKTQTAVVTTPANAVAWQQYLRMWHPDEDLLWRANSCPDTAQLGMACLRRQGNLNQILHLNTPVLLELGSDELLLLKGHQAGQWLALTDSGVQPFTAAKIEADWLGTYFVMWPLAAELIGDTMPKAAERWAQIMAEVIDNQTISDEEITQWVTEFQQQNGLLADGIVGKETQMALSLKAYQGPKLRTNTE